MHVLRGLGFGIGFAAVVAFCVSCTGTLDLGQLADLLDGIQVTIDTTTGDETLQADVYVDVPDEVNVYLEGAGETVFVSSGVVVIDDVQADVIVEEVPDLVVLGFDNQTGNDIFVSFFVDGESQGVFVFADEALLLEYPCFDELVIDSEQDFDVVTGEFVGEFVFDDNGYFTNPENFGCGDLFNMVFDETGMDAGPAESLLD